MDYEIRWLTSADEMVLDRVAPEVFDEPIDPVRRAAYLADPRHHLAVAIKDGEVVAQVAGVVYRHPDKAPELFIDEVGVTPALQRHGIARALLDEMLARGKALGCEEGWVGTEHDNAPARALYESYGVPPQPFMMYTFPLKD
jgi:ribosomal protein S18 acetylase RimI-like enzyme